MKKKLKQFKHLIALTMVLLLAVAVISLGAPLAAGLAIVGLWQLSQFAMSRRFGVCYLGALTPDQVREFGEILDSMKEYESVFKGLKGLNLDELKRCPTRVDEIKHAMDRLNRLSLGSGSSRSAAPGEISEGCALHLGSLVLAAGIRGGQISGAKADNAERIIKSTLGEMQTKTALTSSDIPLPVGYSGEVAALVSMYGTARKYGTVFPLGDGVVKLPRLKTDPTFGLITGSGTVTEKSPQTEWVTFTAEKFGGLVRIPSEIDEDSVVSMGRFLAEYGARQIAYVEDWQFWRSTGAASAINGTAKGLVTTVVDDSKTTTSTGLGSPSEFTLTHFRTLRGVCDAAALRNAAYYLHPSFDALLSTFNTSGNRPYNPNAQIQGTGANPMTVGPTLDGFPIYWVDVLPVYTTSDALSTVHVLFGNAKFQYLGVRGGMRFDTSRDAGFATDEVLVRMLERLTTGKMATGCMGGLITAAA